MKIKTAELIGPALRYCVAKGEGYNVGVITAEEQWERFIEGSTPEEVEEYTKEYAKIKAGFKNELCKIHDDGYKSVHDARAWNYDTDWAQGGPIIEREGGTLWSTNAMGWRYKARYDFANDKEGVVMGGPTPLIAAMRCRVASKLGDEVDVPEELL